MQTAEHHREQFELAYATAWAKDRDDGETPEQLAAEIKAWRVGDTYEAEFIRLRFGWEGYQWARAGQCLAQIEEPAGAAPAAVAGPTAVELQMLAAKHTRSVATPTGYVCDAVAAVKEALARWGAAPALEAPAAPAGDLFDCEVRPHPLRYPLAAYHHAPGNGPLHATWQDKPHRIVYDLVAAVRHYAALAAAPQAPAGLDELRKIAEIAACWGCDHPDEPGDTEVVRRVKWASRQLRAVSQAPAAPSGLPSGWVPCILTHDGQHPEEVAYGPQIMMDRLKKWLGRYFELLAQAAPAAPAVDAPAKVLSQAARDVLAERRRQVEAEGWTPEHDDQHDEGEMCFAAAGYAAVASDNLQAISRDIDRDLTLDDNVYPPTNYPWPRSWEFKPCTPRRALVKSGALILAEIERIDRCSPDAAQAAAKGEHDAAD